MAFETNCKDEKNSLSGYLMSWLKIKKIILSSLTVHNNNEHSQSDCDMWWKMDFIWQLLMTSSVVGLRSYNALPKAKVATEKGHGHSLVVCCPTDPLHFFWTLAKPLHLRSILSKSIRYTENYNACSQYWLTERAQFSKTIPDYTSHNQHFKRWTNWTMRFCLICHIHLISSQPSLQPSQQLFAGKTLPQLPGGRKCFPRIHWTLKHGFLCYRNKQTYFSLAKMSWL